LTESLGNWGVARDRDGVERVFGRRGIVMTNMLRQCAIKKENLRSSGNVCVWGFVAGTSRCVGDCAGGDSGREGGKWCRVIDRLVEWFV